MHSSRFFARLADSYRKQGNLDRAIEVLKEGLQKSPDYLTARIILAACFEEKGDHDNALKEYEYILKLDPFHTAAMKKMSALLASVGRLEESKDLVLRYLEEVPDDEGMLRMLATLEDEAARGAGRDEKEAETEESVPKTPFEEFTKANESGKVTSGGGPKPTATRGEEDELISTMTLAEIYASQGFYDKAIEIYGKVLAREPSNEIAKERIEAIQKGGTGRRVQVPREKGPQLEQEEGKEKVDWDSGGVPGEVVIDEEYERFKKWLSDLTRKKAETSKSKRREMEE